jgi:predicted kinase
MDSVVVGCSGWRGWFASGSADCSYPAICVTSLNMRKWMRERLQRRKKKSEEQVSQPAPPPLQPAYFDAEEPSEAEPESRSEAVESAEKEVEAQPIAAGSEPVESEQMKPRAVSGAAQRSARGRRRRGGRGRGGRGREQAVAQAFTPKGAPGAPPVKVDSAEPDSAEAEPAFAEPGEAAEAEAQPVSRTPQAPAVPAVVPSAPSRPPKGIVVLAIGLPGSGKSSWFKRHNVVPLSSDMVRSLLFDDVREQRFQDLVFSNLRSMLKARLIAKRPMNYVDATNLTPQERQHWVKLAKDYNYEVHAVFFDVPLEVCVERHQRRDRVVAEDVMRRMAAKLKPPAFQEGFAKITVVRVKKKDAEPAEQAEA